jgi:hypothetical protein
MEIGRIHIEGSVDGNRNEFGRSYWKVISLLGIMRDTTFIQAHQPYVRARGGSQEMAVSKKGAQQ